MELTADLQLDVDIGALANSGHDVTQKLVTLAEDRVHQGTDTDKTSGNGELQIVALGKERDDPGSQGLTDELSGLVGKDLSWSDLDLLSDLVSHWRLTGDGGRCHWQTGTNLEHSAQDTSSSYTSLQLVDGRTRLVDIERSNDDQPGVGLEVVLGDGDLGTDVLVDGVDVVFKLGRDGDDGCVSGDSG